VRLNQELAEARREQIATADVLRIISSSPENLKRVFETILENATRICEAKFGNIYHFDGKMLHFMAGVGTPPQYATFQEQRGPFRPTPSGPLERVIQHKRVSHTADAASDSPLGPAVKFGGARSFVSVPMLKGDELIGVISIYRQEVRPFTDKQIELVQNFAVQAVIAIENARLLSELRQRTADLSESLEQQTATAEVLKVISGSPGDLAPVFESLLANAKRLCDAKSGTLLLREGSALRCVAIHGATAEYTEARQRAPVIEPAPDTALGRVLKTEHVVQIADIQKVPGYVANPVQAPIVQLAGARSILSVPMLKEKELVGVVEIYRQEVQPFTDKQIALLQNFAAQAVIAIENARLLNELRESLEQQTATADVLRVISSSVGQLKSVFEAILANAIQLCEANFGNLFLREGNGFRTVAIHSPPSAYTDWYERHPFVEPTKQYPYSTLARLAETKEILHIADLRLDRGYLEGYPPIVALVDGAGARTDLLVPMLKEDQLIGAIVIYRTEVRPFSEKQIELVQNFAAQAVIAIENSRLLNELRESLERQTATADILRVIASTPEDSKHALDTIAETASRMFGVANVNFRRIEGDVLRIVSSAGPTIERLRKALPDIPLELTDPAVRCFLDNHQIPIEDRQVVLANERGVLAAALRELPVRSQVFTPLSREGKAIGVMIVTRGEVQPFQQSDLDLMKGFADQAVIAIENARLLSELRQRTADLGESLEQQTATSEVLRVISSSPGKMQTVFETILVNATQLCGAKFGILDLYDGGAFRAVAMHNAPPPYIEARTRGPVHPGQGTSLERAAKTKQAVQVVDVTVEEPYLRGDPFVVTAVNLGGLRTVLSVAMLKENEVLGVINIYRQEVRPFTDKQIELVQNFASQAVIAIENTRLLNDLNKLNQQLEQRVADQIGEIERMGRLRRFLPPQVADLIVASGTERQLESHRREITALFCDLRGFTGFSESADPEDVMTLLRDYHGDRRDRHQIWWHA
jgi:GAF domain-containing protein